jgi:hypothetical protein
MTPAITMTREGGILDQARGTLIGTRHSGRLGFSV